MPAATRYTSTRRFGARYGRKIREKLGKVEEERKLSKNCPYCHKPKVKRLAAGIWHCTKCDAKFAGKAYSIGKKTITAEIIVKEMPAAEGKTTETIVEKSPAAEVAEEKEA